MVFQCAIEFVLELMELTCRAGHFQQRVSRCFCNNLVFKLMTTVRVDNANFMHCTFKSLLSCLNGIGSRVPETPLSQTRGVV